MSQECRECFPRHRLQRKTLVNYPGVHHGTCVTHVPWWMPGSITSGGGENVPSIPVACATRNFTYLVRVPCDPNLSIYPYARYGCMHLSHNEGLSKLYELVSVRHLCNTAWYFHIYMLRTPLCGKDFCCYLWVIISFLKCISYVFVDV